MMMSAFFAASATVITSRPAARAEAALAESSRSPTTTFMPLSFRFIACAWPCEPKPITAMVLPSSNPRLQSVS
jgi:hypothetical protein